MSVSHDPSAPYFVPTAEWIAALQVGDMAPDCFGRMAEVTRISAKSEDIEGRPFVCLYTKLSETSQVSGSFKAGELHRSLPVTQLHTSAELDQIEREAPNAA